MLSWGGFGIGLNQRHSSGGPTGPWTPNRLGSTLKEWIDPTQAATITGSPVSRIVSPATSSFNTPQSFQRTVNAGTSAQPAITANRLVFNGTSQCLDGSEASTWVSTVTPADPFYCEPGKGPTTVGIAKKGDGTWWIAHYGKKNQATAGGETFDGSLINYSADFSTIIQEIRFQSLGLSSVGVQNVAVDPSNGNLWCSDAQNGKLYKIDPSGPTLVTTLTFAGVNGMAYNSIANELIVSLPASQTMSRLNPSTGAVLGTITCKDITDSQNDALFFDPNEGSAGMLYSTGRDNGFAGRVIKYDVSRAYTNIRSWFIPTAVAVEGCYISGNDMWICSDEYYHSVGSLLNRVHKITLDNSTPDYGTRLILAGVVKIAATPGATVTLFSGGDAVTTGANARRGIGLNYTTTANQFRCVVFNTATQAVFNWTIGSTTTEYLYYIDIDTVAHTATLTVNGTLVSSLSDANCSGSIPCFMWTLAADYANAVATRFSAVTVGGLVVTTGSSNQAEIEGFLSWQTQGSGALLPVGHTYKNAAP